MADPVLTDRDDEPSADWQRRVVGRSLRTASQRSVDRGFSLIRAAAAVLERSERGDVTVQEVADEAGQSLRTLYQYFESKDDLLLAVFEEAMRTYASLIRRSIGVLDDPLERLAGAMLAAVRMPELNSTGNERGLARLRLRLSEVDPDQVARAQSTVTALVRDLVEIAASDGRISIDDVEAATFNVLSLNAAYITAGMLGNDAGVTRPEVLDLVVFCLRGFGAEVERSWVAGLEARLWYPGKGRSSSTRRITTS